MDEVVRSDTTVRALQSNTGRRELCKERSNETEHGIGRGRQVQMNKGGRGAAAEGGKEKENTERPRTE